jgi:hypothetical protein
MMLSLSDVFEEFRDHQAKDHQEDRHGAKTVVRKWKHGILILDRGSWICSKGRFQ